MILLYMSVSCVLFGSSAAMNYEDLCYGKDLRLPFDYLPFLKRQLYFTPKNQGVTKLLMDNGEAKDPRLKISTVSVRLTDLRDRDEGTYSISIGDSKRFDIVELTILDCAEETRRYYGELYTRSVPRQAEYLEFSPQRFVEPQVLWNRTDPQTNKGGRGQMKRNIWEIKDLTQADSGYYSLRRKDNTLYSRIQLIVQEHHRHYEVKVNERLLIKNPVTVTDVLWTVNFRSKDNMETITLLKDGSLPKDESKYSDVFERIQNLRGLMIHPVQSTDAGFYEFRDKHGNLAQTVEVQVEQEIPTFVYVGVTVGIIFAVIICCCCVRRCCCKKRSPKRNESAPAVYYHDQNQPAGPSYSAAPAQAPANPHVPKEPAATYSGSSVYNPLNVHVSPCQPEVAAPGGEGATPGAVVGSDFLSLDHEPTFELKGLSLPSAPPLSSTSTFCDVYTSDKLNFL